MHIFAIVINNKTILRMKKLFIFLVSIGMALSLTSCVSTAYAQTDEVYTTTSDDNVNVEVVISYGVPVFDETGFVMYYLYKGWYYYPYWITDRYYFHVYRHPLTMDYYRRWYRPVPRDFHRRFHYDRTPRMHKPHHSGNRMRPHNGNIHNRPSVGHRPSGNHNRTMPNINRGGNMHRGGSMGNSRPMAQPRSSTRNGGMGGRPTGGGHFGGSRGGGRR